MSVHESTPHAAGKHLRLVADVVDALSAHDTEGATCGSQRWRLEQVEKRIVDQVTALQRTRRLN